MKINKNMEKYRFSLIDKKSDLEEELKEINLMIFQRQPEYKERCGGVYDLKSRIKCFKDIFGDLPKRKETIEAEIKSIELDLLEEKYANMYGYSDVDPFEVVEEKTPNLYLIRSMESVQTEESRVKMRDSFVVGGFFGRFDNDLQEWNIRPDENSQVFPIRRHKDGNWYDACHNKYSISSKPIKFYDFNF